VSEARDAAARLLAGVAATGDPRRRLEGAKMLAGASAGRDELSRRLRAVASLLRDMGALQAQADERALANADLRQQLDGWLRSFTPDRVIAAFATVDRGLDALDRNASPKIVADWVALNI
jgi:hypothetical protein